MLDGRRIEPEVLAALLEAAQTIGSDFELAELLVKLASQCWEGPRPFFAAVDTIGSDFEQRRVLAAVVEKSTLDPEMTSQILRLSLSIGSDFELAELLVQLCGAFVIDGDLRPPFMEAAETIGSQHERQRVLTALAQGH